MLTFVSTNADKIMLASKELQKYEIAFATSDLEMIEIQSDSSEEIVRHKARQAYEQLGVPVIVSDHAWSFLALNGFPGPYMKYINAWFTTDDFLNLMKDRNNRTVILTEAICYADGKNEKVFMKTFEGYVLDEPRGSGVPNLQLICLTKDGKSVSEYLLEGKSPRPNNPIWSEFAKWYKTL